MEKNLVEKYDRLSYRLTAYMTGVVLLITIGYIVYSILSWSYGKSFAADFPGLYRGLTYSLTGLFVVLVMVLIWLIVKFNKNRLDENVRRALCSEMLMDSANKAAKASCCGFLIAVMVFQVAGSLIPGIPLMFALRIILAVGTLAMLFSLLYHNREHKA